MGAYRDKIQSDNEEEREFLQQFYPTAQHMVTLLAHMNIWNDRQFEEHYKQLESQLNQLNILAHVGTQNSVLYRQLAMIFEVLPSCFNALKQATYTHNV